MAKSNFSRALTARGAPAAAPRASETVFSKKGSHAPHSYHQLLSSSLVKIVLFQERRHLRARIRLQGERCREVLRLLHPELVHDAILREFLGEVEKLRLSLALFDHLES